MISNNEKNITRKRRTRGGEDFNFPVDRLNKWPPHPDGMCVVGIIDKSVLFQVPRIYIQGNIDLMQGKTS